MAILAQPKSTSPRPASSSRRKKAPAPSVDSNSDDRGVFYQEPEPIGQPNDGPSRNRRQPEAEDGSHEDAVDPARTKTRPPQGGEEDSSSEDLGWGNKSAASSEESECPQKEQPDSDVEMAEARSKAKGKGKAVRVSSESEGEVEGGKDGDQQDEAKDEDEDMDDPNRRNNKGDNAGNSETEPERNVVKPKPTKAVKNASKDVDSGPIDDDEAEPAKNSQVKGKPVKKRKRRVNDDDDEEPAIVEPEEAPEKAKVKGATGRKGADHEPAPPMGTSSHTHILIFTDTNGVGCRRDGSGHAKDHQECCRHCRRCRRSHHTAPIATHQAECEERSAGCRRPSLTDCRIALVICFFPHLMLF